MYGKRLWIDLKQTFRPQNLKELLRTLINEWTYVMDQRDLLVDEVPEVTRQYAMIENFTRDSTNGR